MNEPVKQLELDVCLYHPPHEAFKLDKVSWRRFSDNIGAVGAIQRPDGGSKQLVPSFRKEISVKKNIWKKELCVCREPSSRETCGEEGGSGGGDEGEGSLEDEAAEGEFEEGLFCGRVCC